MPSKYLAFGEGHDPVPHVPGPIPRPERVYTAAEVDARIRETLVALREAVIQLGQGQFTAMAALTVLVQAISEVLSDSQPEVKDD